MNMVGDKDARWCLVDGHMVVSGVDISRIGDVVTSLLPWRLCTMGQLSLLHPSSLQEVNEGWLVTVYIVSTLCCWPTGGECPVACYRGGVSRGLLQGGRGECPMVPPLWSVIECLYKQADLNSSMLYLLTQVGGRRG